MTIPPSHGGSRPGSGRKSQYGEATKPVRVPESQVETVLNYLDSCKKSPSTRALLPGEKIEFEPTPLAWDTPRLPIPLMSFRVQAGFPSPADDYIQGAIDLNEHLILHREATFVLRVSGWSMRDSGIHDGDELIVDRSLTPVDGNVVIAVLDNELTCKRLRKTGTTVRLLSDNPDYPEIVIGADQELTIWGVVTRVLHRV
ncbi:MAG: translesion error-prone DNA polymerase V autoproteolytic subunit [Pseudomonadota bacterium]